MFKKIILTLAMLVATQSSFSMIGCKRVKSVSKKISRQANFIYKLESFRTAAIRSLMAYACLSDGHCSAKDATINLLALSSLFTALAYDANNDRRCNLLPKKLNFIADAIATVSSTDAGYLPITNNSLEVQLRSLIGGTSMITTAISFLFE